MWYGRPGIAGRKRNDPVMPSREPKGSFFDPEYRRERAREAARESHRSGAVTRLIHALPHLTDEQIQRIRDALPPVDDSHGDAA